MRVAQLRSPRAVVVTAAAAVVVVLGVLQSAAPALAASERSFAGTTTVTTPPEGTEVPEQWRPTTAPGVTGVLYAVLPHPDDEFEVWSQVQNTPDLFKVFVLLTRGEQTANCAPDTPGYEPAVEPAPVPMPRGRWTASCEQARLDSWRGFFTDMAVTDPSVPATFTDRGAVTRLAGSRSTRVCRVDGEEDQCASRDRTARVWTDDGGHGALVVFDLGDGDLTPSEVAWAMQAVRDNRSRLGIDPTLPSRGVVGSYYDEVTAAGFQYRHPDHRAVAKVLWSTNFGLGPQMGAAGADDLRATVKGTVSETALDTAFGPEGAEWRGAHARRYGWLWRDDTDAVTGGVVHSYQVDRTGQRRLFHRAQLFWKTFDDAS
ncbi:hypothetical protein SAMN06264364_11518 [Quadrisphaera granulorum]|uniref:GlcNAc-PI de-N-acetylase n=1 Tax=Quadrisphaera granulorum TaxID=317664 RepID=A0A316A526_9ACTN|nr:hypothetical protein [Quadrisphaera granulorum]PWJ53001.1 hypothetical protein BXY45_11518 [Quadrisphaera granulorum]SZE97166.1 hypothetical protein SAMN06264364_11518 [Quadrisphaera granulorum]